MQKMRQFHFILNDGKHFSKGVQTILCNPNQGPTMRSIRVLFAGMMFVAGVSAADCNSIRNEIESMISDMERSLSDSREFVNESDVRFSRLTSDVTSVGDQWNQFRTNQLRPSTDSSDCNRIEFQLRSIKGSVATLNADLKRFVRERTILAKRTNRTIRKNEQIINTLHKTIRKRDLNPQSFKGLRRALELHENSLKAFRQKQLEIAQNRALRVREILKKIIGPHLEDKQDDNVREQARQLCEATHLKMKQIREKMNTSNNKVAQQRLSMVMDDLNRACSDVNSNPLKALRIIDRVHANLENVRTSRETSNNCKNRIERFATRVEQIETGNSISSNRAQIIFDKGMKHFEQAKTLCANGKTRAATAKLDVALKLITKAVDAGGSDRKKSAAANEIKRTRSILESIKRRDLSDGQRSRLQQAYELLEQASTSNDESASLKKLNKATQVGLEVLWEISFEDDSEAEDFKSD